MTNKIATRSVPPTLKETQIIESRHRQSYWIDAATRRRKRFDEH
jgi:hypothetical protein